MKKILLSKEDVHKGSLILVNARHKYQPAKQVELVDVAQSNGQVWLERRTEVLLNELMRRIGGWEQIVPVSGWRSRAEQKDIWQRTLAESGEDFARKYVALPGHSEHETGLAIDLGIKSAELDFIRPSFPYDGICRRFRKHAASYGFIERYPAGKETVTGIAHEPWHFRYVGVPHADLMAENEMTLEEYTAFLKAYPYGTRPLLYRKAKQTIAVSYLTASHPVTVCERAEEVPFLISGNNVDGFVVTEWRENDAQ